MKKITHEIAERDIIRTSKTANFFGLKSSGLMQVRGNGVLILTCNELYFMRYLPNKKINIPLSSIVGIEIPKSFMKKRVSRPLMKVIFINEMGMTDEIAWFINRLDDWVSDIRKNMA